MIAFIAISLVVAAPTAEVYLAYEGRPPVVVRITLPNKAAVRTRTQAAPSPASVALTKALAGKGEGLLKTHDLDGDECLTPVELVENLTATPAAAARVRLTATADAGELFDHYDRSEKGHIAPSDIGLSPEAFAKVDANGDGKLSSEEFAALVKVLPRVSADLAADERVAVTGKLALDVARHPGRAEMYTLFVAPGPRGAFEWLDADRDGKLSRAELRAAGKRNPGTFKPGDIALTLLPGEALSYGVRLRAAADVVRAGPDWFRAMDRNDDGFVSRAEWLGDGTGFAKLDADGDGLISPKEAGR